MNKRKTNNALALNELFESGKLQLEKIHGIVEEAVKEEQLLSNKLNTFEDANPSFVNKLADRITYFGGSWKFIIAFAFFMLIWTMTNHLMQIPFDPYPFIFLNLLLSTIAALQAPLIMMSQNRKEEKDRERAVSDYMVNLKAEIEVRNLHGKIDVLVTEQMKTLFDIQEKQIELLKEMREQINEYKHKTINY